MGHENGGWMNQDQREAMKARAEKVAACPHLNFNAGMTVNRIPEVEGGPVTRFMADVSIRCADCDVPFRFLGLPIGMDLRGATVSFDGKEAHLAIAESGKAVPPVKGVQGYTINKAE